MYVMHTGEYPLDLSLGYDQIIRQIREGVPRARAEALGTEVGRVISVMLRRHEQYRYTSPAQVWEDLRRLDVWSIDGNSSPVNPVPSSPMNPPPSDGGPA